jgi:amino acid transporter
MAEPPAGHPGIATEFSRDLKLLHITMMGVGMMIGAGVFLGVGNATAVAGPGGVLLTFALNGVIALFSAMAYAELSSAIPRAGGAYNFARIAFGRGTSFLAGWMEWFASSVAGSLYAVTFGLYTVQFACAFFAVPADAPSHAHLWGGAPPAVAFCFDTVLLGGTWAIPFVPLQKAVAVLAAVFFLYINFRGASETGRMGAVFTLGQTLTLAFIAVAGIVAALLRPEQMANFQPFLPEGWSKLLITMGFTYVAFEGFEVIAQTGDEAVDPRRNLPKAMLYSILIVVVTYVGVAFAAIVAAPSDGLPAWRWIGRLGGRGFGEAIALLLPWFGTGRVLVTLAVICASTSALNATIYSATRACYALGRDHMLPPAVARLSPTRRTPHIALLVTGALVIAIAVFLPVIDVASSASMMFLFLFFLVNLCVIRIRRHMGDEMTYGFVMPLFPFVPIAAIAVQILLAAWMFHMSWIACVVAPAWVLGGAGIYVLYSRRRAVRTQDEIVVLKDEPAPPKKNYRVLVAVGNPENALGLVTHCYRFCQARNAEVEVVHMVPVPPQVPLTDASTYALPGEEAIAEAMLYLAPQFTFGSTMRYCRNPARGIVSAAAERKADLLILGWRGHRRRGFTLGSTVDPVMELAPCDVAVFKNCKARTYERILVPYAGGPNSAFALETAAILGDPEKGRVTLFHVAQPGRTTLDAEAFLDENAPKVGLPRGRIEAKYEVARDVLGTLLRQAEEHDLVVIGATRERLFQRMAMGSLPEAFARLYSKALVMVKARHPIKSLVSKWL